MFDEICNRLQLLMKLGGYTSAGETEEEVLENIKEAIQLYLQPESIELAPGAIAREIIVS